MNVGQSFQAYLQLKKQIFQFSFIYYLHLYFIHRCKATVVEKGVEAISGFFKKLVAVRTLLYRKIFGFNEILKYCAIE